MNRNVDVNLGCLPLVVTMLVLWGLIFGVNVSGKHYGVSCGCDGVSVQNGVPK